MGDFLRKIWGQGPAAVQSPVAPVDDDFADFAGAPEPTPASIVSNAASDALSASATLAPGALPRPFTKWYRVWERVYISDFYSEMIIIPFLILVIGVHFWGSRKNRRKAKGWLAAHGPVLQQEFASIGFSGRKADTLDLDGTAFPDDLLKEKTGTEFLSYATGRNNIAFTDIKLTLAKRYNPMARFAENVIGYFFESMPAPAEKMEATSFVFDGRENTFVPGMAESKEKFNSTYDGFVWAVVHKESMKTLRDARYDLSLTSTRDHPKLPVWATIMSESAEITDTLLTPELLKAIESAGEALESFVVSDQSAEQPKTLNEALPKKRISLSLRLPRGTDAAAYAPTVPLFQYFIRTADLLASHGRFRPEAMRRVKATREEEIKKIKRAGEDEKAEERRLKVEKEKKKERDDKLKLMSPEQQKKFLEKERQADLRKAQKSRSVRA